jgi:stage IV sporulation protein FB
MKFHQGYLHLGHIRGAAIRVHWSLPLGMWMFSRFEFRPWAWLFIALLVLIHELGHAAVVWASGRKVIAIDLLPIGGLCHWDGGHVSNWQRAAIAFGGVWAQLIVLVVAWLVRATVGVPDALWAYEAMGVFISTNLFMMAFNLMPIPPLDGATCWKFVPLSWARIKLWWVERKLRSHKRASIEQRLKAWDDVRRQCSVPS